MSIGSSIPKQFEGDHGLEAGAIKAYNEAVALAVQVKDNATREFLEGILRDEDRHIDEIEEKQDQITQMGEQLFLSANVG